MDCLANGGKSHPAKFDFCLKVLEALFQLFVKILERSGHLVKAPAVLDEFVSRVLTLPLFDTPTGYGTPELA